MQTPDNAFYYHAAYVAIAVIHAAYATSLYVRRRRVRRERTTRG